MTIIEPLLTEEQSNALRQIDHWLNKTNENFFILKGSAGTGKTFCIRELTTLTS
jgi:DNA replication protein DnaC